MKWEYKTISERLHLSDEDLNELGSEGWELMFRMYDGYYKFKREIK